MSTTLGYIKEWQKALQAEILHLKKYGSSRYLLFNGRLLSKSNSFSYYFDTPVPIKVPVGSSVKVEWGTKKVDGRILSSEGKSVILSLEENIGADLAEVYLHHDPWELLDQLYQRLGEMKESKRKRARIKKLMDPSMPAKHPAEKIKTNTHELILRSKYNPVTYVWGPPGTGKTYTLARVAANKYFKGHRVLILSHSNQAVDVLMAETFSFIEKKGKYREGDLLRYGSQIGSAILNHPNLTSNHLIQKHNEGLVEKKDSLIEERRLIKQDLAQSFSKRDSDQLIDLEKKLAGVMEKIRQKEVQLVKDADVIGTTLAKAASDPTIYEKDFDLVIVDEASMAYVPQAAFAASLGKRVIICGDFKQLPPIATARHPLVSEWLREDIFHKSGVSHWVQEGKLHPHLFLLKEQRRMHPDISSFTNKYVYHSLVGDHESVLESRENIARRMPFPGRASIYLNSADAGNYGMTDKNSKSRVNMWQLLLSFQLIHESFSGGARSIGYVTPYRSQALLMEQLLGELYEKELSEADIIAATVHRFQGSEREVMIFDTVDSAPHERAGMLLTGKESERLLNVAITRTKGKFIHVSDLSFIRSHVYKSKIWRKLAEHQINKKQAVYPHEIGTWIKNQHPHLNWMHARKLEQVKIDITAAKSSIILCLPKGRNLPKEWISMLNLRSKRTELSLISPEPIQELRTETFITNSFSFPYILIDGKFIWLGIPVEALVNAQPPYVAARLESKIAADYLLSQTSI